MPLQVFETAYATGQHSMTTKLCNGPLLIFIVNLIIRRRIGYAKGIENSKQTSQARACVTMYWATEVKPASLADF